MHPELGKERPDLCAPWSFIYMSFVVHSPVENKNCFVLEPLF